MNEQAVEVRKCQLTDCSLHRFRLGRGRIKVKEIRKRCLACAENLPEIKKCPFDGKKDRLCHLYPYRMGKNPACGGSGRGVKGVNPFKSRSPKGKER